MKCEGSWAGGQVYPPPRKKSSLIKINARSGTTYSRVDQLKFFKGRLPQVLLVPFLNSLTHLYLTLISVAETESGEQNSNVSLLFGEWQLQLPILVSSNLSPT